MRRPLAFVPNAAYVVNLPNFDGGTRKPKVLVFDRPSPNRPWLLMRVYHSKAQDSSTTALDGLILVHPRDVVRKALERDVHPPKVGRPAYQRLRA